MWGNTFTSFSVDMNKVQEKYAEAVEALMEEARSMLIEDQLQHIFKFHSEREDDCDLFITALQFRLLRQHRYFVSSSVFDKFKSEDNEFKETLKSDAKGMLSLYEAAHLRIHGETILEEAVAFTTHHLNHMLQQLESPLQDQVKRALQQPTP
ncbi:UNVERIFIED_CONTAM: 5-epi-aristolochene synthase 3 [Sesamum latifolium]|uniref:5-epi-aristolochene synthase 3 n=1 Tax=Sesamum latifolium TaxID=2727402 RepID=A0AAW2U1F1_9LAMI